ncbi:MAG: putative multidrug ABC transporter permease YbhR [Anaerolineales bacterium]|nr:putative multidrug ABC transporter permease YbhR [Anaerolineales bacterium]
MFTRIWNLVLKELTQLMRDRLLAPFIILGPTLELIMVAYSTSAGIAHLPTAVIDLDHSQQSRALVVGLRNTETFDLRHYPSTVDALAPLVDRGSVSVGVIIPHGFAADLANTTSGPPQVQVIVDGSEPAAAQEAIGAAQGVVATFGQRVSVAPAAFSQGVHPIDARVRVRFNEELKESNYTIPSEAGFMLSAIAMMVASLGIARERELGTLEQLMVTPLRPIEMIIGKVVPAIILSYIVFLLMLAISLLGFGVPMRGSWPLLLTLAAFYLFVELGWGIMASAISANQLQALLLVFVFVMIEVVFSGYAFPVENMPQVLQLVANLFPIKHWLIVFRSILLKGAGPSAYWQELVALAVLGTGIMSMTVLLLRRQRVA